MKSLIIAAWKSVRLGFLVNYVALILIAFVLIRVGVGLVVRIRDAWDKEGDEDDRDD
ncbi:MAG: hypothetical protein IJL92_04515 [Thermoguttaceae bacterium]|nr:hypothetical protein [Thermoguttaceae bacterium]